MKCTEIMHKRAEFDKENIKDAATIGIGSGAGAWALARLLGKKNLEALLIGAGGGSTAGAGTLAYKELGGGMEKFMEKERKKKMGR
jgi:hypothetical protein